MSIAPAWGDYDNDGDLDLCVTTQNRTNQLYRNLGNGAFEPDPTSPSFPATQIRQYGVWGDYDNDGWLDLFMSYWDRPCRLFHNRGDGTFEEITTGSPVSECRGGGAAWADYDNDGFLDLCVVYGNTGVNYLYRNNPSAVGNTNGWLKVKLVGTASNRDGIGATIRVKATIGGKELWQMRQIVCQSYASELIAHFGLGDAKNVDLIRVEWPSGNVQELVNSYPDQVVTLREAAVIAPSRPSASLNASVTLTRTLVADATYQWCFDGAALAGQTSRTLNLTNIVAEQEGRYSVVVSNASTLVTNYVYLHVDTQFTQITTGPVVDPRPEPLGCAWGDYDNDGYIDLFVTDGAYGTRVSNSLFRNNGDGTFMKTTTNEVGSIVGDLRSWANVAWADYDHNGFLDLMVSDANGQPLALYRNRGDGKFDRVTDAGPIVTDTLNWGTPCWGDFNQDGLIDLFMANSRREGGVRNALYQNTGDGMLTRVAQGPLVTTLFENLQGAGWSDLDGDGDLDVVLADSAAGPEAFRNDGGGKFVRVSAGGLPESTGTGITPSFGDYDNDGLLDVFVAGYNSASYLFHNEGDWRFTRILLGAAGETSMGAWGDYDNDGDLDLFITRGQNGAFANLLYRNNGDGTFTRVTTGSLVTDVGRSPTCVWGDYDNDGFLDLFVPRRAGEAKLLYHNNGNSNHWVMVKLVGTRSNRAAIGAKVRARALIFGRFVTQMREIPGGNRAQDDLRAHFGLGNATQVATLRVEWPCGAVEEFTNVAANQILTVWEPPAVSAVVRADGACELTVKAEPNRGWQIKASSDLLTWQTLTTVTNTISGFQFTDTAAAGMACRFYRVESE